MKKLFLTTVLALTLAQSGASYANEDEHGAHEGPPPFMQEALSKLPDKDAAQFRATMKQSHEKDKALFERMHKLHSELHDILAAEKFDKTAYVAKGKELEKLHDKMHANMIEAFATAAGQLPQDERKILADATGKEHHEHHHKKSEPSDGNAPSPDSSDK